MRSKERRSRTIEIGPLTRVEGEGSLHLTVERGRIVDLRLEIDFGSEVQGWFLTNFNNLEEDSELSRTTLRFDRGLVTWRPAPFEVRFFDNEGVSDFEDPGALVDDA